MKIQKRFLVNTFLTVGGLLMGYLFLLFLLPGLNQLPAYVWFKAHSLLTQDQVSLVAVCDDITINVEKSDDASNGFYTLLEWSSGGHAPSYWIDKYTLTATQGNDQLFSLYAQGGLRRPELSAQSSNLKEIRSFYYDRANLRDYRLVAPIQISATEFEATFKSVEEEQALGPMRLPSYGTGRVLAFASDAKDIERAVRCYAENKDQIYGLFPVAIDAFVAERVLP